ncbi:MAG: EAL domain-containing protein [Maricaulaceae bacterium]|nr:EAL domain-containing protein [Maricaulaceae bacterium]
MLRVIDCLVTEHDLRLVLLAGLLCVFAACAAAATVRRAAETRGAMRAVWLGGAAFTTGGGVWGVHFIAMLAYAPGPEIAFGMTQTLLSAASGIVIAGLGWSAAVLGAGRVPQLLGGALVGLGVVVLHYTGMAGMVAAARIEWAADLVVASTLIAAAAGAAASRLILREPRPRPLAGAAVLTLGVVGLHFTGMGALNLVADPTVPAPDVVMSRVLVAWTVAFAAIAVLGAGLMGAIFDRHLSARRSDERRRLRELADASFEGVAVELDGRIIDANARLCDLLGVERKALLGRRLEDFAEPDAQAVLGAARDGEPVTCRLRRADGESLPVDILSRPLVTAGGARRVFALRDARDRETAAERIRDLAQRDPLTGLANRARFRDGLAAELEMALREGRHAAVMCMDLDGFKSVNDLHGHGFGDALLVMAADRLRRRLPPGALAARLGGDEFAVLLPGVSNPKAAAAFAELLLEDMAAPYEIEGVALRAGATAGLAMFPGDGEEAGVLMRHAGIALDRAREESRGGLRLFEPAMDAALRERRRQEEDLRAAIEQGELELRYQPQALTATGEIAGFEALVRWNHPERGRVGPDEFIPLAEETGLILPMGEWVLHEACREASRWPWPIRVAVNVSPAQFRRGNLALCVEQALKATGLDPARLEVEITEGVLIADETGARRMLARLKALGVRIAMDDFGTGYSSLSYLRSFPFDKIKIDRSFVSGMAENRESRAIVRATVSLASDLGVGVVAEGVETAAELAFLRELGCTEVQGYLIAPPVTPGEAPAYFGASPPHRKAFTVSGKVVRLGAASAS